MVFVLEAGAGKYPDKVDTRPGSAGPNGPYQLSNGVLIDRGSIKSATLPRFLMTWYILGTGKRRYASSNKRMTNRECFSAHCFVE